MALVTNVRYGGNLWSLQTRGWSKLSTNWLWLSTIGVKLAKLPVPSLHLVHFVLFATRPFCQALLRHRDHSSVLQYDAYDFQWGSTFSVLSLQHLEYDYGTVHGRGIFYDRTMVLLLFTPSVGGNNVANWESSSNTVKVFDSCAMFDFTYSHLWFCVEHFWVLCFMLRRERKCCSPRQVCCW